MYEIFEHIDCDVEYITDIDIIKKVDSGISITIKDKFDNAFNIEKFNDFYVKIYPLASIKNARKWYKFTGEIIYPTEYDKKWISKHTIFISTLPDIIKI